MKPLLTLLLFLMIACTSKRASLEQKLEQINKGLQQDYKEFDLLSRKGVQYPDSSDKIAGDIQAVWFHIDMLRDDSANVESELRYLPK